MASTNHHTDRLGGPVPARSRGDGIVHNRASVSFPCGCAFVPAPPMEFRLEHCCTRHQQVDEARRDARAGATGARS